RRRGYLSPSKSSIAAQVVAVADHVLLQAEPLLMLPRGRVHLALDARGDDEVPTWNQSVPLVRVGDVDELVGQEKRYVGRPPPSPLTDLRVSRNLLHLLDHEEISPSRLLSVHLQELRGIPVERAGEQCDEDTAGRHPDRELPTRTDHMMICVPDLGRAIVAYTRIGFNPNGLQSLCDRHQAGGYVHPAQEVCREEISVERGVLREEKPADVASQEQSQEQMDRRMLASHDPATQLEHDDDEKEEDGRERQSMPGVIERQEIGAREA